MSQNWDPEAYARAGAFVPGLAGGVLEWLDPRTGEQILDIGCGDGQLSLRIADAGATVTGVDSSAQMVAAARERGVRAEQASVEELPFRDGAFDAAFSNAVLHWVRDHDAMMREVHRVLRPGARFVAEFGGHGNIAAIVVAFAAALEKHGFAGREENVNYYPTPAVYRRRLERHGFKVDQIELIPRPTPLATGIAEWLRTFRRGVLEALPESAREAVVRDTEELLAPVLRDEEGQWTADYVRLRFRATR